MGFKQQLLILFSLVVAVSSFAANEVPNFRLLDAYGGYHELQRLNGKAVVLFVAGNECPIVRQSASKIRSLRREFSEQGITFLALNANTQDERRSIRSEAEKFDYGVPVLLDEFQSVAASLGVTKTAEAFLIDLKSKKIIYRGAIDDQLLEGGKKAETKERYLKTAIAEHLAGKEISKPQTTVYGCKITFTREERNTPVSYIKDIAPILLSKCVECHSKGNIGPFAMDSHKRVKGWSEMIKEVTQSRRMPPWHADPHYGKFSNDRSLTKEETQKIADWVDAGAPRGEGEDPLEKYTPPADPYWFDQKPDLVVKLPKPEKIPANGTLNYRYIDVPCPLPKDTWIRAAMVKPGNPKVVHHVIVRVKGQKQGDEVFFSAWAPGNDKEGFPDGTGKLIPANATLNFEMHYSTIGSEETDQTELGLYFLPEAPKVVLETREAANYDLSIPPGEQDARQFALYGFKKDSVIYDLVPHMHLRGSWMKFEALYPNGKKETLLSVPNYDFNWQIGYRLAQPKKVPAGTWILCTGAHDNSPANPFNPDPKKRVKFGLQSWDEMFIGFMNVAELPAGSDLAATP